MYRRVVLVICTLCVLTFSQQKLPPYITACYLKDPNFQTCALENANYAIPRLIKGDKQLGIPALNPLRLPLIDIEQSNFKLSLKDVKIVGLQDAKVTKISLDRTSFEIDVYIDNLNIVGTYNMAGKILLLNLQGEGPANITAIGGLYNVKSALTSITKNDQKHLQFGKPRIEFTLKKAMFDFGNLLDGNEKLGPEINQILNENWQDIVHDIGAPIKETVSAIVQSIVSNILDKVPENQILPE